MKTILESESKPRLTKVLNVRIHHLSKYTVELAYNDKPDYLIVSLSLKNYTESPNDRVFNIKFMIFMSSEGVTENIYIGKSVSSSSFKPSEKSEFESKFSRLEYFVDGILRINHDVKKLRRTEKDKIVRRKQIKELKKEKCKVETSLVNYLKMLLNI